MEKNNLQSVHCYNGTEVLINKKGFTTEEEIKEYETYCTLLRLSELYMNPIKGKFDFEHLKAIHRHIFQDVYYFAGELRSENIAKGNFMFAPLQFLGEYATGLFQELKEEKFLVGLSFDLFIERLAYFMSEINVLHPFREGNGRTQREFIRLLALENGYTISWDQVDKEILLQACIRSTVNTNDLVTVLKKITEKSN